MHEQFANRLYSSRAWRQTRKAYAQSRHNLCERCLRQGLYVPGVEVHHKIPLTPENIDDPRIALSWDNLELLCRDCHDAAHLSDGRRRWKVDPAGHILAR